jgi:hypothetical protein
MRRSLALFAVTTVATGCVQNDQSLIIRNFAGITAMNGGCTALPSNNTVNFGIYDAWLGIALNSFGYMFAPVVQNNIVAATSGVETHRVLLQGVEVELRPAEGGRFSGTLGQSYKVPSALGTADPGGTNLVTGIVEAFPLARAREMVTLLDNNKGGKLADGRLPIVAHTRVYGLLSGSTVYSGWVDFPIEVCGGCLDPGYFSADDKSHSLQKCPDDGVRSGTVNDGACYTSQDFPVTCCKYKGATVCGSKQVPIPTGMDMLTTGQDML